MDHLNDNPPGEASQADLSDLIHHPTVSNIQVDAVDNTPARLDQADQDNPNSVYPPIADTQVPIPPPGGPVPYYELPGFETPSEEDDEPDRKERRRLREKRHRQRRQAVQNEITAGRMLPPTTPTKFKLFTPEEHNAKKAAKSARERENRKRKKAEKLAGGLIPASSGTTAHPYQDASGLDDQEELPSLEDLLKF